MLETLFFTKVWGASQRGPAHQKSQQPNQDYVLCRRFLWGTLLVISDGLGSKKYSHIGARMACKAVRIEAKSWAKKLSPRFDELLQKIRSRWIFLCNPYGAEHCAATCLFCLKIKNTLYLAQLGDGLIMVLNQNKQVLSLEDSKQENFTNMTSCLSPTKEYLWRTASIPARGGTSVFLCTDGISEDILPDKKLGFAVSLINHYSKLSFFLRPHALRTMLKKWPVPLHSDDKSLAVLQIGGYHNL